MSRDFLGLTIIFWFATLVLLLACLMVSCTQGSERIVEVQKECPKTSPEVVIKVDEAVQAELDSCRIDKSRLENECNPYMGKFAECPDWVSMHWYNPCEDY